MLDTQTPSVPEPDSEAISSARIVFSTVCKGREGRFKSVGSERGIPERQPELWMDWGGFCPAHSRDSRWNIHSPHSLSLPCPMFIIHLLFFWQIPNHMTKINQYSSLDSLEESWLAFQEALLLLPGNTSVQQKFPCKSTAFQSFKLFFFILLGGKKTWYTTLLGFFVVFIKFFQDITKLHTLKA